MQNEPCLYLTSKHEVNHLHLFPLCIMMLFFSKIAPTIVVHLANWCLKSRLRLTSAVCYFVMFSDVSCGVRNNHMYVIKQRLQQACAFFLECILSFRLCSEGLACTVDCSPDVLEIPASSSDLQNTWQTVPPEHCVVTKVPDDVWGWVQKFLAWHTKVASNGKCCEGYIAPSMLRLIYQYVLK
jgi:hypothetical protein